MRSHIILLLHTSTKSMSLDEIIRVRNLKFATYLKFATCENTNEINELW